MILISLITERILWRPVSRIHILPSSRQSHKMNILDSQEHLALPNDENPWMEMMPFIPIKARIQGE
jgi:hypothetical protein